MNIPPDTKRSEEMDEMANAAEVIEKLAREAERPGRRRKPLYPV